MLYLGKYKVRIVKKRGEMVTVEALEPIPVEITEYSPDSLLKKGEWLTCHQTELQ